MRYHKNRRFRHRQNGRIHKRNNGVEQGGIGSPSFLNDRPRNNNRTQNAERLVEKYNILAKEAISSGDKILSENYFQHADHFMRIVEIKKLNQSKVNVQVREQDQEKDKEKKD